MLLGIFHDFSRKIQIYFKKQLNQYSDLEIQFFPRIYPDTKLRPKIKECLQRAEILLGYFFPKEWLACATSVKLIISPYAGVVPLIHTLRELKIENSNFEDVILVNSDGNARFVAQHIIALLFSLTNRIIHHHNKMKQGIWNFKEEDYESYPLFGKTIGLLGYGEINQRFHQFLQGFPVNFAILKRHWEKEEEKHLKYLHRYIPSQLPLFLNEIDVLIIAVPYTQETKHMIGTQQLEQLGSKGILINVARGAIVDEQALFKALQKKKILGAGIDVWYDYSPNADEKGRKFPYSQPFHELNNVIMSPHRADSPFEEKSRWENIFTNIQKYLAGDSTFHNEIDLDRGY